MILHVYHIVISFNRVDSLVLRISSKQYDIIPNNFIEKISANEICINASSVHNAKLAHRWLLIMFFMEKPLSDIVVLEGITSTPYHKLCKTCQLVNHSQVKVAKSHSLHHLSPLITTSHHEFEAQPRDLVHNPSLSC